MKLLEIYNKYKTTPSLQEHMLNVAGLAKLIVNNMDEKVALNRESLIQACLFHDIAKIISFKTFKDNEAELQKEYVEKYGDNEHLAANKIVEEIPLLKHSQKIVRGNNIKPFLDKIRNIMNSDDYEMKILKYADSRIAPEGLVTLKRRWNELVKRYPEKANSPKNTEANEIMTIIEKQIQDKCKLDLVTVTQSEIDQQKLSLENLEIL